MNEDSLSTDVLVIGGGVAALRAAIAAREAGADVIMCCKGVIGRSGNTVVSTADMSAYVSGVGSDDSEDTFAADTLQAGASIADESLVRLLAERSGQAVLDLQRLGVPLLRDGDVIDRTRAAGHSRARTYRANAPSLAANKGLALSVPLAERARALGVRCLDRTPTVELIGDGTVRAPSERICGAVAVDFDADRAVVIRAGAVIVGAGGASVRSD
ncbi:MAG: aspartate oxidase [Chloroflexi bacterium]|nr:aspartate oxidase [Chloroflexota bacterium]